jgi:hypothetical protein
LAAVSETVAPSDEVEVLRARIAELERELTERTARANAAVAAAEDRLYWLERWQVDLDALMQHRTAQRAFRVVQFARRVRRFAGRIRRRMLG